MIPGLWPHAVSSFAILSYYIILTRVCQPFSILFPNFFLHLFSHVFSLWFYLFLYFLIFLSITSISFFSHSWYHSWEVLTQYHNLWLIKWCWSQKPQLWCKNYFFAAMSLLFFLGGKNYWYAKENWPDKWSYFIFTYKTCSSYHGNFADPDGL